MQLSEKHIINLNHSLYKECDNLCFNSKNIYNRSMFLIKQDYVNNNSYDTLNNLYNVIKNEECYKLLPPKVAQQTLRNVSSIWKSYFALIKSKKQNHVGEPKFLKKTNGRFVATFTNQAISKKVYDKAHKIKLSQCNIEFYTKVNEFSKINCVRIIPCLDSYTIEVIYEIDDVERLKSNRTYFSVDLGVNNLAAVTCNKRGYTPFVINGKPLKSINQYYNKKLSHYKSKLVQNGKKSSHRLKRLTNKRTNKINDYLHKASNLIVNKMCGEDVRCLIIGKNDNWKQGSNIGSANNQNFVNIPHSRFISMLTYKCEKVGISVRLVDEAYTSKCSFLDGESIEKHTEYIGKRIKRGLFRASDGRLINADINGSYNIMKKAVPTVFDTNGIEDVVVHPLIITIKN